MRGTGRSRQVESSGSWPPITSNSTALSVTVRGEGPDLVERAGEGHEPVARHRPVGRLHPHDPAQRGGLADRAARVGPERQGGEPGRHRRGRAPRRATGDAARVMGVVGRPEGGVLGGRPHGELVEVGLADHDGTGGPQARHHGGVVGRVPPFEDPRRARGGDAARAQVVLERDRHPRQRAGILPRRHLPIDLLRVAACRLVQHGDEGVQLAVDLVDGVEVPVDDRRRRRRPVPDANRDVERRARPGAGTG